jgi:tetratricopeptide (TPR) repeat protein
MEMKGDHEGCARERAVAARLAPADDFDFFLMGRESVKQADWASAIAPLMTAIQGPSDHFWPRCLLAICHLQTGEPGTAWVGLNTCLEQKPDRPWLYLLRGIANTAVAEDGKRERDSERETGASESFKAAEADFRRAIAMLGDATRHAELHYALLVDRGMMWLVRNDLSKAEADFREAICLMPKRDEAFIGLGQVYQRQRRTNDALQQFAKAIELRPNWAPLYRARANVLLGVTDLSPELREMTLSDLENAIGNLSDQRRNAALRDLAEAIRHESPHNHLLAADLTKKAALLRAAERYDEALDACEKALKIARTYPRAHAVRIKVLVDLARYNDLLAACNAQLEWAIPTAHIYELRAVAKNANKDFTGAIGDLTRALDLADAVDRPRILSRRGWSYATHEAPRLALKDFDEAIRLSPTNTDAYLGRGLARARMGHYRDAVLDAENAARHGDATANFAFRIACIYGQAAAAASAEPRHSGPRPDRLIGRCQDSALTWVREALKRTPAEQRSSYLREAIQRDPALHSIRGALRAIEPR